MYVINCKTSHLDISVRTINQNYQLEPFITSHIYHIHKRVLTNKKCSFAPEKKEKITRQKKSEKTHKSKEVILCTQKFPLVQENTHFYKKLSMFQCVRERV